MSTTAELESIYNQTFQTEELQNKKITAKELSFCHLFSESCNWLKLQSNKLNRTNISGHFYFLEVKKTNFENCKINSGMNGAEWKECLIKDTHFDQLSGQRSKYQSCMYQRCTFDTAKLSLSSFENVIFEDCIFNQATFWKSTFQKVEFRNCTFNQVNFSQAYFEHVKFIDCSYNSPEFDRSCDLSTVSFIGDQSKKRLKQLYKSVKKDHWPKNFGLGIKEDFIYHYDHMKHIESSEQFKNRMRCLLHAAPFNSLISLFSISIKDISKQTGLEMDDINSYINQPYINASKHKLIKEAIHDNIVRRFGYSKRKNPYCELRIIIL